MSPDFLLYLASVEHGLRALLLAPATCLALFLLVAAWQTAGEAAENWRFWLLFVVTLSLFTGSALLPSAEDLRAMAERAERSQGQECP